MKKRTCFDISWREHPDPSAVPNTCERSVLEAFRSTILPAWTLEERVAVVIINFKLVDINALQGKSEAIDFPIIDVGWPLNLPRNQAIRVVVALCGIHQLLYKREGPSSPRLLPEKMECDIKGLSWIKFMPYEWWCFPYFHVFSVFSQQTWRYTRVIDTDSILSMSKNVVFGWLLKNVKSSSRPLERGTGDGAVRSSDWMTNPWRIRMYVAAILMVCHLPSTIYPSLVLADVIPYIWHTLTDPFYG